MNLRNFMQIVTTIYRDSFCISKIEVVLNNLSHQHSALY